MARDIFHNDLNGLYASVDMTLDLGLLGKASPSVVETKIATVLFWLGWAL